MASGTPGEQERVLFSSVRQEKKSRQPQMDEVHSSQTMQSVQMANKGEKEARTKSTSERRKRGRERK